MRKFFLSAFGLGPVPGLPGTYASAVTAAGATALASYADLPWVYAGCLALAIGTLATLGLAPAVLAAAEDADPSWIVTDEVAGQGLALAGGYALSNHGYAPCVLAFVLFRAFDIAKPWPIRLLERLPGATGVLADDLGAGAVAGLLVCLARSLGLFGLAQLSW